MTKYVLFSLALMTAPVTQAGTVCSTLYENNTLLSQGCELGTTNNDSQVQVNVDDMFGSLDWVYIVREPDDGGVIDPLVDHASSFFEGEWISGSFVIDWDDTPYTEILFVQKGGKGNPDTYVGWLLNPNIGGEQHYAYNTAFTNPKNGNLKEISHVTWYGRVGGGITGCADCTTVPVPASVALLLPGLFLLRKMNLANLQHKAVPDHERNT